MRRTKIEKNILFLCEDNACLSLMAESMAKQRLPKIRVFSAGIGQDKYPGSAPGIAGNRRRTFRQHDQEHGSDSRQRYRSGGFLRRRA